MRLRHISRRYYTIANILFNLHLIEKYQNELIVKNIELILWNDHIWISKRVKPYSEERSYFCQIWMVNDKFVDGRDTEHPVPGIPSLTRAVIETRGQRSTISLEGNQEHLVVLVWSRNQQKLGLKIVIDWSWSCDHPCKVFSVETI